MASDVVRSQLFLLLLAPLTHGCFDRAAKHLAPVQRLDFLGSKRAIVEPQFIEPAFESYAASFPSDLPRLVRVDRTGKRIATHDDRLQLAVDIDVEPGRAARAVVRDGQMPPLAAA